MTIYVITHKHFNYQKLPANYVPLLVGASKNMNVDNFITDNKGDNISNKNASFCELTGLYWIWKHTKNENIGLAHYRRYFSKYQKPRSLYLSVLLKGYAIPINVSTLDEMLNNGTDWIVAYPQIGGEGTLWDQFNHFHHINDLKITQQVIKEISPEVSKAFIKVIKHSHKASFYNMFYTSKDELNMYCRWLFKILF